MLERDDDDGTVDLGIGKERSQKGSNVTDSLPQVRHFRTLLSCPMKIAGGERQREIN